MKTTTREQLVEELATYRRWLARAERTGEGYRPEALRRWIREAEAALAAL